LKNRGVQIRVTVILLFTFLSIYSANAQVIIYETVEIVSESNDVDANFRSNFKNKIADPGALYYPDLREIGFGKYRVLKSGYLKMYVQKASFYNRNLDDKWHYTVSRPDTVITGTNTVDQVLGTPITYKNPSLRCNELFEYHLNSRFFSIPATKDSWVSRSNSFLNYGDSLDLVTSGYSDGLHPDSASASVLLQFDLQSIQTNGEFGTSQLVLQADTNNSDLNAALRVFPITEDWDENTVTYNNRPKSDLSYSPSLYITSEDLVLTNKGDTLPTYATDITPMINDLRNTYFGIQLASFSKHFFASREFANQIPQFGGVISPPTINVELLNTADNSDNDSNIIIGYVQAGDTLDLSFGSYSDNLFPNYELLEDSLVAEELLSFSQRSGCASSLIVTIPTIEEDTTNRHFEFVLDTPQTIPIDTLLPIYQATLTPELAYQNGDTTLPDIFASYTMELYDVPEVDGFPIAIFSERDDDGPGSGSFTDLVSLDDFTRSASLLARTDSLTQDSTFKVRVYGYMVKGLMAGKMAAQTTNAANDLFNLPPGYSVNNDINDPNCGLPINAVEDNIFVHCLEFRIGDEQPEINLEFENGPSVWPTLRNNGIDGGNPNNRNIKNITVTLTSDGKPIPNEEVELQIHFILNSGGHDHITLPDSNLLGSITNLQSNTIFRNGNARGITNIDGQILFEYTASQISGEFQFTANTTSVHSIEIVDTLSIQVPILEFLGASPYFELVGAPQYNTTTNDPCRTEASLTSQHAFGHFGTSTLNSEIHEIAESFYLANDSTKLRINDMSLESGGIFDTRNNWINPHSGHRVGNQVDIGIKTILKDGSCNSNQDPDVIISTFLDSGSFINTIPYTSHYHVQFN
jgi:hypothetical protein